MCVISVTHMTLNESDASESITLLYFKSRNAHFTALCIKTLHTLQRRMVVLGK